MAPILELRGVKAFYGQSEVVHGIDVAVEEGGMTVLLGANGAGKTTTLRAICGMVRSEGEIRFAGQQLERRTTEQIAGLGVAHVPEGRGTFMALSVEENLRLGPPAGCGHAAHVRLFPDPRRAPPAAGRFAVRRRAADAGDRARADDEPAAPGA
jgi:ABC-type branched-subunit amino acid transport system ATPase component